MEAKKPVRMELSYQEETDLFCITYFEEHNAVFQCRMVPSNFEAFTADLVRTVKDYNLFQAKLYQEKINAQKDNAAKIEVPDFGNLPDSPCPGSAA